MPDRNNRYELAAAGARRFELAWRSAEQAKPARPARRRASVRAARWPTSTAKLVVATLLLAGAITACDHTGTGEPGGGSDMPHTNGAAVNERAGPSAGQAAGLTRAEPVHPLDEQAGIATVGLDSGLLAQAMAQAAELPRLHNMIIARHGRIELERHFRGPRPDSPANVKSVSKSLLSALVGVAVAEGHLEGVDQAVTAFFAAELGADPEPARAAITLGHLLSMRSGLESTSSRNYGRWVASPNWVRYAITRPLVSPPGERMVYSTGNTHLLSAMLTRATGQNTHAFARDRLASPLGIRLPAWPRDPQGVYFGGNDMLISPRDLLRFGELYRNGGEFEGRQIVPRDWVVGSWQVHARSPRNRRGYGLGWWGRESNGYQVRFAWGYGGQFLFIIPALELTIVFTSDPVSPREGPHNAALHRMVDELLVPAAIAGA